MEQRVTFKGVDNSGTIAALCTLVSNRKQERVHTLQVVRYHVYQVDGRALDVSRIGTTLASDVSTTGMFLSHAVLTPGTRIHFYFELPTGYIEAVGKVVHNQHRVDAAGTARPGAGVRFISMSASDKRRLESYLGGRSSGHRFSEAWVS
ncbi:MAG TPA: PilZ domain-containing protein [Polyangia bacterium]